MDLGVYAHFDRAFPRGNENLLNDKDVSSQAELMYAANSQIDVPPPCALFRRHQGYALSGRVVELHSVISRSCGDQFTEPGGQFHSLAALIYSNIQPVTINPL